MKSQIPDTCTCEPALVAEVNPLNPHKPVLPVPLHRDSERVNRLVDDLLRSPDKARCVLIDAIVGASALVDTINATGGMVRDGRDGLVPEAAPEWLDLADAAYTLAGALQATGVNERLQEDHNR